MLYHINILGMCEIERRVQGLDGEREKKSLSWKQARGGEGRFFFVR